MTWILSLLLLLVPFTAHAAITGPAGELWRTNLLNFRVGYGRNSTGGDGGVICTVSSLADSGANTLRDCIGRSGPQWIIFSVSGTINLTSDLIVYPPTNGTNKTIDGRGATITITGGTLLFSAATNIIVHNLTFSSPNSWVLRVLGGSQDIWFDHLDIVSGANDQEGLNIGGPGGWTNAASRAITVSYVRFRPPIPGGTGPMLIADCCNTLSTGATNPSCGTVYLDHVNTNVTLHHNWYNGASVRHPLTRYSKIHSFNNWYDQNQFGVQAGCSARYYSQSDIFDGQPSGYPRTHEDPWNPAFGGDGTANIGSNLKVEGQWSVTGAETYRQLNTGTIFNPASDYSYTLETADAALRTKLQDPNTGTGRVPNPYNSVSATGPPTVTITGPTSAATYTTSATPLSPILSGTATDDVGVVSVSWACPTCTPTSGTATCATCGASATSVSWSVASIGLASGANVITVTATDTDSSTGTDTLTVTRGAPDVTTGLIAHYKFNDNASPATDSTGLGHSGTLVGTPAYVAGTTNMGRALSLNGTTQYVTTLDAANLDFTTAYTLAAWINPPATLTGNNPLIVKNYQGTPGYYLYANITSSANCGSVNQIVGGHQPGQVGDACTTTTLPAGTWSHVAVTFDGTNTQLYVNGVASGLPRTPSAAAAAGTGTLDIGHSSWGEFLPATVDDVRVYNRALTATDMAVLGVLPDIATGLRAHYKFNDAAGTATDSTGLGHTGTFVAGATYGAGPPNLGNALALNGTTQYVSVADAADLDFTTAYTLTGWFFLTSAGTADAGIVKPGPGTPQYAYYLYPRIPSACGAGIDAVVVGYNPSNQVCYATALTSNQWTHVGVTFANGSATTLYVGGIPVATGGATAPTVATAQALLLGNSQFSEFFAGRMDEIRLYNRELTAVDMNAVASVVDASNPPTVTITTDCGAGAGNNCTVSSATLTTFAGTATDDVGVPVGGITWTCPTCTPTSGTATCATCGPSATSVSWSVASITLASGTNVLTVTVLDADGQASTPPDSITITYTVVSSTVPTVLRLVR